MMKERNETKSTNETRVLRSLAGALVATLPAKKATVGALALLLGGGLTALATDNRAPEVPDSSIAAPTNNVVHFHGFGVGFQVYTWNGTDWGKAVPDATLFDDEGNVVDINSSDVNEYLRSIVGEEFTAKDFRTWAGTVLAARALTALEEIDSNAARKKNIVRAVEVVAQRLGNTKAVCRKCYIHPDILYAYMDGSLAATLSKAAGRELAAAHVHGMLVDRRFIGDATFLIVREAREHILTAALTWDRTAGKTGILVPGKRRSFRIPIGGIHGFRNDADAPATMLIHFAPGAPREGYFEGLAEFGRTGRPGDEEMADFYARHDNVWI